MYKNSFFKEGDIWFHACSLGEVRSLKPLIDDLNRDVNISVITDTGFKEAKKLSKDVRYLPFEIFQPFWQKRQKVLAVFEAELWYMLFFTAKKRGDKTILINARISDNSYSSYKKFAFFYRMIFKNIDKVFAQTEKDRHRLLELGAKNVEVTGNIKAFADYKKTKEFKKPENKKIVVLASTHEGEERLILENIDFKKDICFVVVPRHPERFKRVDEYLFDFSKNRKLKYVKFSENESFDAEIVLCDRMGELVNIYAISDTVILGGSFIEGVGGHNPLEPASFNLPIISGKYFFNQHSLYDLVENIYITDEKELKEIFDRELKSSFVKKSIDMKPITEYIKNVV